MMRHATLTSHVYILFLFYQIHQLLSPYSANKQAELLCWLGSLKCSFLYLSGCPPLSYLPCTFSSSLSQELDTSLRVPLFFDSPFLSVPWRGLSRDRMQGMFLFAEAWNSLGHEAIGMTAMSGLKGTALTQIKRLMNGKDVVDVSSWAHKVNAKYPSSLEMHFFKQRDWKCDAIDWSSCNVEEDEKKRKAGGTLSHRGTGVCLLNALRSLYGRLVNKNTVDSMVWPRDLHLSDSDALKYFINLLGDLHQPLHVGFRQDDCGRLLQGTYADSKGQMKSTSLFNYWDKDMIDKVAESKSNFWHSGWTHINSIKEVYEDEKTSFAELKEEAFDLWAVESLRLACENLYLHPLTREKIRNDFSVDSTLETIWFQFARQRILIAGARLAIVLNDILQSRDASKLRIGTSVSDLGDDETTPNYSATPNWLRNLAMNLAILVFVLAILSYMTRYYTSANLTHRKPKDDREMVKSS